MALTETVMTMMFIDHLTLSSEIFVSGSTIFAEFLERHGEGVHHVTYDCNNIPFEQRLMELKQRGFQLVQSMSWMGENHSAFCETEHATTTCIETYIFPDDWQYPIPRSSIRIKPSKAV